MKIACLSGKGGAGKTLTAVNLAAAAGTAAYIDCDVEEPNGRLFLKPENVQIQTVNSLLPAFDGGKCIGCKKCVQFCRFHALTYIKEKPMVFSEVCHSCGGCLLVCPENAVTEINKPIGIIEMGWHQKIRVVTGILNPGEASGVPIIREALKQDDGLMIIDCPPGSACSVMESVRDADYCILIAEPTVFGFHNFKMVWELVSLMNKKCGVVINKQEVPYEPLEQFCQEKQLPVLARIPYDKEIAEVIAGGKILTEISVKYGELFHSMLKQIGGEV
ncbi:MAG: ATP-binding protein [Lachnospiraceae bacterium]|nr:ATP-binding protein [Lachnospiraceae bacterium]